MANFIKAALVTDVADGAAKTIDLAGKQIALFNVSGKFYAVDNKCRHRGGPLAEGDVDGTTVTCPWHGWEFTIKDGRTVTAPVKQVKTYPVIVEGDTVLLETSGAADG